MSQMRFEITRWEESAYGPDDALYAPAAEGPAMARVSMAKRWSGLLEGTSAGEVQTCGREGYLASERIDGTLDGRGGTFVLQHGATLAPDGTPRQFAYVVPGSGTGELEGLSGEGRLEHGLLQLDWTLPAAG